MEAVFSKQDLDLLFEAVESWESEDRGPGMMGAMLGSIFIEKNPESRKKYEEELKTETEKANSERRLRKERGCLLRAKLITLRDTGIGYTICDTCPG